MKKLNVVMLAAGKGERMVSKLPKVMHEIMGRPMIGYVIEAARSLKPEKIVAVLGFGRPAVEKYLLGHSVLSTVQEEQKGTAHALLTAEGLVNDGDVLVLYGDVPLIKPETLESFVGSFNKHRAITFMTTDLDDPSGYGRVIVERGAITAIIEHHEATPEQKLIRTINTGICLVPQEHFRLLKEIDNNNRKGEFYLTDIVTVAAKGGLPVVDYRHPDSSEVLGINNRHELMEANGIMRDRVMGNHLARGVTILDRNAYIDAGVTIGMDTVIYPNVWLMGATRIGEGVRIGPNVLVRDSTIGDGAAIEGFAVVEGSRIAAQARIEPFSRLTPDSVSAKGPGRPAP